MESGQSHLRTKQPDPFTRVQDARYAIVIHTTEDTRRERGSRQERLLFVDSPQQESESLTHLRCPSCQKMLAKCSVRGMIEISCPRCKAIVRTNFS
jgi:hypothetical protein